MRSSNRKDRPSRKPVIRAVRNAGPGGSNKPRRQVAAGDLLEVRGRGFGKSSGPVKVCFDKIRVTPLRYGFSDERLLVLAPLPPEPTRSIVVEVAGRASAPYPLKVTRPSPSPEPPGTATREMLTALDELTSVSSAFAAGLAKTELFSGGDAELLNFASAGLDKFRRAGQQVMEKWMELLPGQKDLDLGAMRAIEFYDGIIHAHGLTESFRSITDIIFGLASPGEKAFAQLTLELFGAPFTEVASADGDTSISVGDAGFLLHEGVKFIKGTENLFKAIKPSAEVGTPFFGADVEISLGELISAVAELVDIIAQILIKMASSSASAEMKEQLRRIEMSIERMEEKSDRIESTVTEIEQSVERFRELVIEKFNKTWEAFDTIGSVLGRTLVGEPWVFDPTTTTTGWKIPDRDVKQELHDIEDKIDRLEEKADRGEEKLDRQEEKLDRLEEKQDRDTILSAPEEGSLAGQRGGGERVTGVVVATGTPGGVKLRAAIDVAPAELEDESKWTDWKSFGAPPGVPLLAEVSIQAAYSEGSNDLMEALLSARDAQGFVYHRVFSRKDDALIAEPTEWGEWKRFLNRP